MYVSTEVQFGPYVQQHHATRGGILILDAVST